MDLFEQKSISIKVVQVTIEERIEQAVNAIFVLYQRGLMPCVAFSGGKGLNGPLDAGLDGSRKGTQGWAAGSALGAQCRHGG